MAVAPATAHAMAAPLPILKWLPIFVRLADGGLNSVFRLGVKWLLILVLLVNGFYYVERIFTIIELFWQ
jgi:hypothetical protein